MAIWSSLLKPSIYRRILGGFAIILAFILVVVGANYIQLRQFRDLTAEAVPASQQMAVIQTYTLALSSLDSNLERFTVISGSEIQAAILTDLQTLKASVATIKANASQSALPSLETLDLTTRQLKAEAARFMDLQPGVSSARDINQQTLKVFRSIDSAKQLNNQLTHEVLNQVQGIFLKQETLVAGMFTIVFGLAAISLIVSSVTGLLVTRSLVRPLSNILQTATLLAQGKLNTRVKIESRDEIGSLAIAFNSMADQLQTFIGSLESRVAERTRDLTATIEVGKLATSIYSQAELLPQLVEFIRFRFGLYYTQIYLLDEAGRDAILRAGTGEVGAQLLARSHRLNLDETSLVARAVQSGQTVLVTDTDSSTIHKANDLLPDTRSEATIPLIVGSSIIGVLDMQSDQVGAFNQENLPVFEAMASQIAAVLRGSHAHDEAQKATQYAEAMNQRLTAETWVSYLGTLSEGKRLGYVYDLETARPLNGDPEHPTNAPQRLVQPVLLRGQSIGNIVIQEDFEREWKPEEQLLVENAASLVAQALDQYRAFDQIKQAEAEVGKRASELQTVAEVSAATARILDMDELLQTVSDLTKERFGLYHTHIYLLNETGEKLVLAAGAGEVGRLMKSANHQIALNHPNSVVARAARSRTGIAVNDVRVEAEFLPNPLLPETRSEMAIPMIVAGELIGVLDVQASTTDRFSQEDLNVQTTLAEQVAIAIQNARIFAKANQQATVLEASNDFISITDLNGQLIYVNPAGAELTGYGSPAALIGKHITELHLPEDAERINAEGLPAARRVGSWRGDNGLLHKDGHRIPVDQAIFMIQNQQGEITHLATIMTDITERKAHEEALAENERLYRQILDGVNDMILVKGEKSRIVWANKSFRDYYGMTIQDLQGMIDAPFQEPDHTQQYVLDDLHVWETGQALNIPEEPVTRYDGETRLFETLKTPIFDDDNKVFLTIGVSRDITERKQAELERERLTAEAQRSAQLVRTMIDATPDWIFAKDRDYRYILANQGYATAIGTTTGEIIGKTDIDLGFPEDIVFGNPEKGIRGFRTDDAAVLEGSQTIYNPYDPATFADGSTHIFDTQKMPLRDTDGNVFAALGFARDVTIRQQQEEEVRLAREEAEILYRVSAAINKADDARKLVETIQQYIAPQQAFSVTLSTYPTGDYETATSIRILAAWMRSGAVMDGLEIPLEDFTKSMPSDPFAVIWINDVTSDPSLSEDARAAYLSFGVVGTLSIPIFLRGKLAGSLGIQTDAPYNFTERDVRILTTVAEQAATALEVISLLQETQKRASEMETVARVSAATTTILNLDDLLQSVCDLTRQSFDLYHAHIYLLDAAGTSLVLAAGSGDAGKIMKQADHSIGLNHANSLVARAARNQQGVIANDVTSAPDFLPNPLLPQTRSEMAVPMVIAGELIGVLDVQASTANRFTDEDVRIQATLADQVAVAVQNARAYQVQQDTAERLREVDRLKSQFLANMSHELRTPLNSIIGYAEVLLDGIDGDLSDEAVEDVQAIHGGGKHLLSIINDILDLAKIDAGQMHMDRRETDLSSIVQEVVHTCQILVKDKGISLECERPEPFPTVYGDAVRLRQIVYNLVNNAIKFTEQGGITISLSQPDNNEVCVTVKDTGIGMSEKDLSVIFERFQQVDGSATRRAGGTGLGLAITRQLVQMHGGDIQVSSELGEGTTFWFTLPVFEAQPA